MLEFKNDLLKKQYESSPRIFWALKIILLFLGMMFYLKFGHKIIITSLFRENDPKAHGHGCAADIRTQDPMSGHYVISIEEITWLKNIDELIHPYMDIVIEDERWTKKKQKRGNHIHVEINPDYWPGKFS